MGKEINVICRTSLTNAYKKHIKNYTQRLFKVLKIRKSINIVLMDNKGISQVHKDYLGDDSPTDVISFHSYDIKGLLGELVISVEYAKKESRRRKIRLEEELSRYVTHGVLHILGYRDDRADLKKRMWNKQEELLGMFID